MKTIGIVCDDYKIQRFKKELADAGFDSVKISPVMKDHSSIKIIVKDEDFSSAQLKISRICTRVEMHFKRGN